MLVARRRRTDATLLDTRRRRRVAAGMLAALRRRTAAPLLAPRCHRRAATAMLAHLVRPLRCLPERACALPSEEACMHECTPPNGALPSMHACTCTTTLLPKRAMLVYIHTCTEAPPSAYMTKCACTYAPTDSGHVTRPNRRPERDGDASSD